MHSPNFNTIDGKGHFADICSTPYIAATGYTLTTVRSEGQFNSVIYEDEDVYRGTTTRWSVLMSPDDMATLNLKKHDRVTLKSKTGEMKDLVVTPFDLPPGNLMCYYPEANVLTSTDIDPRSKTPSFKATAVTLSIQDTKH
jgi:anaerobic selenocysteine-containing dehydrogenase